eukprot:CAMPEP_0172303124 /NCGR_PEP_ID=MMETSP1058-20130122/4695_1 /TAXON_ID=83371 /ORGANISM="Detonula confervacea, Strain CCMP 353" /LENGTH=635 /DNA_ID=CAMNT_0013013833 /DNA_START=117 /DNA_END=2024 /DNA_ORIENTATION=+
MGGSVDNASFTPIVQVIHLKKIDNKGGGDERWKVILSDGTHFLSGMCATQLNSLVHSGAISQHCILKVNEFIVNTMGSGQKICILLGAEQVGPNPGDRMGSPVDIAKVPGGAQAGMAQTGSSGGGGAQPMYGNVQSSGGNNPYGQRGSPGNNKSNPYGGSGGGGNTNNRFGGSGGASSSSPIVTTSATGQPITPISGLNMYSNRWVIRAKVTTKSDIRTWSNAKGEGSLFSVEILDSSGTDVKCTFFKEAVDKWNPILEEGRTYTFSGGRLKVANMQYNNCKSQFEITFDQNSEIHLDEGSGGSEIRESYDFIKIAQLESTDPDGYVDILAVVKHVAEPATFTSKKSGKEMTKCELTVEDDSGADVKVTMWGDAATTAPTKFANCPIVAFKKTRVSDFGGRTLSGGTCNVEPNIPQAGQLKQWWAVNANKTQSRSLSSGMGGNRGPDPFEKRKDVCSIKNEQLGYSEKPDWLTFKVTITFLKKEKTGDEGAWYTACANSGDPCKNMFKATQTSDGNWHCDKCQQTNDKCVRRFIFSGTVADDTCTSWVSVFNEQAEELFEGKAKADDLYELVTNGDGKDVYDSTFMKATYTDWIMKCKVKQEMVGDEQRVKTSMASLTPVDYVAESRNLLSVLCA